MISPRWNSDDLSTARTLLAVERTFNAWIKTALALLAGGLGLVTLMRDHLTGNHGFLIFGSAIILILLAFVVTAWSTTQLFRRIQGLELPAAAYGGRKLALVASAGVLLVCVTSLVCLGLLK